MHRNTKCKQCQLPRGNGFRGTRAKSKFCVPHFVLFMLPVTDPRLIGSVVRSHVKSVGSFFPDTHQTFTFDTGNSSTHRTTTVAPTRRAWRQNTMTFCVSPTWSNTFGCWEHLEMCFVKSTIEFCRLLFSYFHEWRRTIFLLPQSPLTLEQLSRHPHSWNLQFPRFCHEMKVTQWKPKIRSTGFLVPGVWLQMKNRISNHESRSSVQLRSRLRSKWRRTEEEMSKQ